MRAAVPPAVQVRPAFAGTLELNGDDDARDDGDTADGRPDLQSCGAGQAGQDCDGGRGEDDGRPGRRAGGAGTPHADPGPARLSQGQSQQRQAEGALVLGGRGDHSPEAEAPQRGSGTQGLTCAQGDCGTEAGGRHGHGDRQQHHHQPDHTDGLDPHTQGPQGPGRQAGDSRPLQAQALTSSDRAR